jgi:23S rRNA (pseudouridine1915-N3)-methyltransferase
MKIRLIWPGKTKEQFILEGMEKYLTLLKPYCVISITEVKAEKGSDSGKSTEKEGERILKLHAPYALLDEKGKSLTSAAFAAYIIDHGPQVNFVLGGAFGVSDDVRMTARDIISLSRMTFTHEMARLFFLEQLYRAFTIVHKRGYHH